jgi:gliding motility-associated-like protein
VRLITTNQVQTASGGFVSCVDTVENTVLVINDLLQFPNTVTPNGDGINDIFEIKNLIDGGGFTDNELYIYNHWGRKVYHKTGISTREDFWDPAANNDPDGTYYYRFSAKGYMGNILRNGTITVVR